MLLTERYQGRIRGVLSCPDRVVITGTLVEFGHAQVATRHLKQRNIRIFDFAAFGKGLRDRIRSNAEQVAAEAGLEIRFIRSPKVDKEKLVQGLIAERGTHPGLVCVLSVLETCTTYEPWHNKQTHATYLKPDFGKCTHYYFYFIDEALGLCYLRVPTWAPYRLQFYFNGHNWLANRMRKQRIRFRQADNTFLEVSNWGRAQALADDFKVKPLHYRLDRWARQFCPIFEEFKNGYHWSLHQVEYATDIVFRSREDLAALYDNLVRTSIHAVKAEQVATFLGRPLDPRYQGEVGNQFHTRIEGTRIRHHMGPVSLKMYDKYGCVLRIETVANDVSFFKHRRKVEHRDGSSSMKVAPLRKRIYSLPILCELMAAANRRYLEFLSTLDDDSPGVAALDKVARAIRDGERTYRGFNLLQSEDLALCLVLTRGEFNISGFQNRDLRRHLTGYSAAQLSRVLKRLRTHGIVKKIGRTYKYYVTTFGKRVLASALRLREFVIIPALAQPAAG
jgi:hypothetical protein